MMTTTLIADQIQDDRGVIGDALRIDDGRITRIGWWRDFDRSDAPSIRFPGCTVVPGFRDAHLHAVGLAAAELTLDVSLARDLAGLRDLIRERAGRLPPHAPVIATGLDDERLAEARMPTRSDLDAILTSRPILVYRHCSHIASANSASLRSAGIDAATPDPPGGRLERASDDSPTGVVQETAIGLVASAIESGVPAPDAHQVSHAVNSLTRRGITAIDAIVSAGRPTWCTGGIELDLLLEAAPDIVPDVSVFVIAGTPNELRRSAAAVRSAGVRFGGWKGFADGSLGGHTALLHAPYEDQPNSRGFDRWDPSTMPAMAETALEEGGRVAIHAIGDAALDKVVGLAESLRPPPGSIRAEHASVADPVLIDRMAVAEVIASVQPQFITSDGPWIERRLGPDRARWAYPFRTMLEAGVTVIGGSDGPIEEPDPLAAIRAAVRRGGIWEAEALELDQALMTLTVDRFEVGAVADLVVVEGDPAGADSTVLATMVAGVVTDQPRRWGATSDS